MHAFIDSIGRKKERGTPATTAEEGTAEPMEVDERQGEGNRYANEA
jgi:hypothetical protein